MGRIFDRGERRRELNAAVEAAIAKAIMDAETSYDDSDAETLRSFHAWWYEQEIPETPAWKAKDA